MRTAGATAIAAGAVAAAAWLGLTGVPWPARACAVLLLVGLPLLLAMQARMLDRVPVDELPRGQIYRSSAVAQWLLALVVAVAAWASGLGDALALQWIGLAPTLGWAAALTLAVAGVAEAARAAGVREAPLLRHLLPRTRGERAGFAGLSVTAGVCEEFIYRGFLLGVLLGVTEWWMALLLSSGAFGLVHAYQRPAGALRAAAVGALLAAPVLVHGSIWPAVIAHALIDILAGLVLRNRLLR